MNPKVVIITPTTGNQYLKDVVDSVDRQTYTNVEHFVVIDGEEREKKARNILSNFSNKKRKITTLPYATGFDNYNGHRIYGAATFLVNGDYFCFLDEDNWLEPNHVELLVKQIQKGNIWAYTFRKIVDSNKIFICNDDCESLGMWQSVLKDNFIDVGCWFLPKHLAVNLSPCWYRRARHPKEQPEVDRLISNLLLQNYNKFGCTKEYTLNYRVGSRSDSVQGEFFLQGNKAMMDYYNGKLPWKEVEQEQYVLYN